MALVSLKLSSDVLNVALDKVFKAAGRTFEIQLRNASGDIVGLKKACVFKSADFIAGPPSFSYVQLEESVWFVVQSETTITNLRVLDNLSDNYIQDEPVTPRTYTSNGTYTVSDLIVKIGE